MSTTYNINPHIQEEEERLLKELEKLINESLNPCNEIPLLTADGSNFNKNYGWDTWDYEYEYDTPKEPEKPKCSVHGNNHVWEGDTYFTRKVFYTCKCGAKKEDEQ